MLLAYDNAYKMKCFQNSNIVKLVLCHEPTIFAIIYLKQKRRINLTWDHWRNIFTYDLFDLSWKKYRMDDQKLDCQRDQNFSTIHGKSKQQKIKLLHPNQTDKHLLKRAESLSDRRSSEWYVNRLDSIDQCIQQQRNGCLLNNPNQTHKESLDYFLPRIQPFTQLIVSRATSWVPAMSSSTHHKYRVV